MCVQHYRRCVRLIRNLDFMTHSRVGISRFRHISQQNIQLSNNFNQLRSLGGNTHETPVARSGGELVWSALPQALV